MIEKFTFELHAPRVPEGQKLILVKELSELRAHVVMKLLAYLIYYHPDLKVEISADMHYKPDLMIPGDHGVPKMWIDCGKITLKKIESLTTKLRNSRFIIVKENKRELDVFKRVIEKKIERSEKIEFLAFEPYFLENIANAIQRTNHITLYEAAEGIVGIAFNDEIFESALYH